MSRLAHARYIRREEEAMFTALDNDLLRRVRDRDAQGAGEEYVVSVLFGKYVVPRLETGEKGSNA